MEVPTQSSELEQLSTWKEEVEQVRGSLRNMRSRLEEMAGTSPAGNHERMIDIEHFQNQFIRQLEVADEMYHDLKQSAKSMGYGRPAIIHHDRPIDDYERLTDRMRMFTRLHDELKTAFSRFEAYR